MANWRDKLRPASFRGVKFFVSTTTLSGGRRGPDHEFAGREEPYAEDTGRKQKKYPVEAYLVGKEYLSTKKPLEEALNKEGPGELVHPYYGRLRVQLREFSISESSSEGGYVKYSLTFVEAGSLEFPKIGADASFLVGGAAGNLASSAVNAFSTAFTAIQNAAFAVQSAQDKVADFSDKLIAATAGVTASAQALSDMAFAIRQIKTSVKTLVGTPAVLAAQMANAFDLLENALDPKDVLKAVSKMFSFGDDDKPISRTTSTRSAQALNLIALNQIVQTLAIGKAAKAATGITFVSVQDATTVRDQVGDQLDKLMSTTSSDDVYNALQDTRAKVVLAVPPANQTLASVATYTPLSTRPSLIVAYDLYGSVDQEQDIINRNAIRNPGFVTGGQALEVLDGE